MRERERKIERCRDRQMETQTHFTQVYRFMGKVHHKHSKLVFFCYSLNHTNVILGTLFTPAVTCIWIFYLDRKIIIDTTTVLKNNIYISLYISHHHCVEGSPKTRLLLIYCYLQRTEQCVFKPLQSVILHSETGSPFQRRRHW